nr:GNAT family N-acetyltransferase [uncultured Methanoregula sp.]
MLSPIPFEDLEFVLLGAAHDLSGFHSSEPELDEFLKEDAFVNQNDLISVTRLVFWNGNLIGFFTLVNESIEVRAVEACDREESYHFRKYPALKIARLATHSDYERFGVGRSMLRKIFTISISLSRYVGCRIITVDSKHSAVEFYKKFAFKQAIRMPGETVPLYLDLKNALQRISPDS